MFENWLVNTPWTVLARAGVAASTAVPKNVNETVELVVVVLVKLNGEPPGIAGVQVCPAAGAAEHAADEWMPGRRVVRVMLQPGWAAKVTKFA
jgi:hypothetical protein